MSLQEDSPRLPDLRLRHLQPLPSRRPLPLTLALHPSYLYVFPLEALNSPLINSQHSIIPTTQATRPTKLPDVRKSNVLAPINYKNHCRDPLGVPNPLRRLSREHTGSNATASGLHHVHEGVVDRVLDMGEQQAVNNDVHRR